MIDKSPNRGYIRSTGELFMKDYVQTVRSWHVQNRADKAFIEANEYPADIFGMSAAIVIGLPLLFFPETVVYAIPCFAVAGFIKLRSKRRARVAKVIEKVKQGEPLESGVFDELTEEAIRLQIAVDRYNEMVRLWWLHEKAVKHGVIDEAGMVDGFDEKQAREALISVGTRLQELVNVLDKELERIETLSEIEKTLKTKSSRSSGTVLESLNELEVQTRARLAKDKEVIATDATRLIRGPIDEAKLTALEHDLASLATQSRIADG